MACLEHHAELLGFLLGQNGELTAIGHGIVWKANRAP